jgi:hypothetical protein
MDGEAKDKGGAGGEAGGAGKEKGLLGELKAERKKRQEAERQLAELVSKQKGREGGQTGIDVDGVKVTRESLVDADADVVNRELGKLAAGVKALDKKLTDLGGAEAGHTVQKALEKFAIFHDEDDELASDAVRALLHEARAEAESGPLDAETVEKLAESVARRYSRYKVKREADGEAGELSVSGGAGGAAAAHVKTELTRPKTTSEAMEQGRGIVSRFMQRLSASK